MVCVISGPGAAPGVLLCPSVAVRAFVLPGSLRLFSPVQALEGERPGQSPLPSHPRVDSCVRVHLFPRKCSDKLAPYSKKPGFENPRP